MSEHFRQQIRADVLGRLDAISGTNGGPFTSLAEMLEERELPAVVVWITNEPVRYSGEDPVNEGRVQSRSPTLVVIAVAKDIDSLEDVALEIERRMHAEEFEIEFLYRGVEFAENREGDRPYLAATLTWILDYETNERDPTRLAAPPE